MKIFIVILIFTLVTGCNHTDKSLAYISNKDSINVDIYPSKNEILEKGITISVSYAALECGCPQWFETKNKDVEFLEGVERFYLEPVSKDLINANDLWDGTDLPLTIKVTGIFSKEKEMPLTYHTKEAPKKARIFWYNKIAVEPRTP